MPALLAASIESLSLIEPPGWMIAAILYLAANLTESSKGKKASLARIASLVYFPACSNAIFVDLTREVCPQPMPLVIGKFLSTIMMVLDLILPINFQATFICGLDSIFAQEFFRNCKCRYFF